MSIVPQIIINSLIAGSIYALVALGFSLIYNATKFFNLAHGTVGVAGGYAVFYLTRNFGLNMYAAIIIGVLAAGVLGYGLDKIIFLPLRKKKASNMVQLVASLGALFVIQSLLAIFFTSRFQTLSGLIPNQQIYQIAGGVITEVQVVMFVSVFLIFGGLILLLKMTRFGHAIMAISDDEEVAKIVGINTNKIIGLVFFIGSCIAGLASILSGMDTGIQPTLGLNFLLWGAMAAIIGGMQSLGGVVLGAYFLAFVENFGIWHIDGQWRPAIAFGLLIVFLIFRPEGIIKK